MVLRAPGDLVLDDVARPRQDTREVQIRVTHSGICGTDFKIFSGTIPVSYPRIMGHEMFGEVVEAGDAEGLQRGNRVIVDPELYCGACFHCRIGQTHLCPNGLLVGRDNVIITPHTSFYSEESLVDLQVRAAEEVVRVLGGQAPRNPVNPEAVQRTA